MLAKGVLTNVPGRDVGLDEGESREQDNLQRHRNPFGVLTAGASACIPGCPNMRIKQACDWGTWPPLSGRVLGHF